MNLRETLRVAVSGISANRLRSALTILGITIGVAAVIVLVAVGNGSQQQVQAQIRALGTNVLTISAGGGSFGPGGRASATATLTLEDAAALRDRDVAPDVKHVAPVAMAGSASFSSGERSYSPATVVGSTPEYLPASGYAMEQGTAFTARDAEAGANVVIVGPTVAEQLGLGVGSTVHVSGRTLTVVAITKVKGTTGSDDADDIAILPLATAQATLTGYGAISQIKVQAVAEDRLAFAEAEVEEILRLRHPASAGDQASAAAPSGASDSSFQILNQASLLETSSATTDVFTTLLAAVAAISLLVGGIGVMNIMLVSVTERTREIGIRKAIGARRADILLQFLVEAVLVSLMGGVLGLLIGLGVSRFEIAGVEPVVAGGTVAMAFAASVLCGLFFGTYPAARAAALKPIDALRFE